MPATVVRFYQDADGTAPVVEFLEDLRRKNKRKALAKCAALIQLLAEKGHELRRPVSDMLRDGIRELRAHDGTVQYRILYSYHGSNVAILAHALTKEGKVPDKEIDRAVERMKAFNRRELHDVEADHLALAGDRLE